LLCLFACVQLWVALLEQDFFSKQTNLSSLRHLQYNPYLLTEYGKQAHYIEGNLLKAYTLIQHALINNPLHIPAWLELCELKSDSGDAVTAMNILYYINTISVDTSSDRWEKALVAYRLGQLNILAKDLSYIIEKLPEKRHQALNLAFSVWEDPLELLKRLGSRNITHIFNFSLTPDGLPRAVAIWPIFQHVIKGEDKENSYKDILLRFINLLMTYDEIALAKEIWNEYISDGNLLYNKGFSSKTLQTAFGWRLLNNKGYTSEFGSVFSESNTISLHIKFLGTHNLDDNIIEQIVPLEPDTRYLLTGFLRTKNITTDQKPFVQITGYNCDAQQHIMPLDKATQDWSRFTIKFDVSKECQAMRIQFRRRKSNEFDCLISGELWVKQLEITKVSES